VSARLRHATGVLMAQAPNMTASPIKDKVFAEVVLHDERGNTVAPERWNCDLKQGNCILQQFSNISDSFMTLARIRTIHSCLCQEWNNEVISVLVNCRLLRASSSQWQSSNLFA